jgi:hypothetical protein
MMKLLFTTAIASLALIACTPPATNVTQGSEINQINDFAYGTIQNYGGSVGSRFAMFQLTWQPDGNVVGSYYHPADNGTITYQLKGKNTANGQLVLTEFTQGRQTAILTLNKSIQQGLITWSGKMHNTDGRVIPVSFTRRG